MSTAPAARVRAATAALLGLGLALAPVVAPTGDAGSALAAEQPSGDSGVWWYDAMELEAAHAETRGEGAVVAVIDDGIDQRVPDLKGADIDRRETCRGYPFPSRRGLQSDHGTAMSTLIAGQGSGNAPGGRGVTGVAPDAQLRFYSFDITADPDDGITCSDFETGRLIVQAAREGADVISASFGMGGVLEEYVEQAMELGAVVVASMGTTETGESVEFPASVPGVVAVSAADEAAVPWEQTRAADHVTILAPGVDAPVGGVLEGRWVSRALRTGTSGAAAVTAGALALVKAKYPDATANQLVQHLIHNNGRGDFSWDDRSGFGVLNVTRMLEQDPTGWPDRNPLLEGPAAAVEAYPVSAWQDPADQPAENDAEQAAEEPGGSDAPDNTGEAGGQAADAAGSEDDPASGVPMVGAVGLGGAALVGAAAYVFIRRTRQGRATRPAPSAGKEG
jgi:hypothetical protein